MRVRVPFKNLAGPVPQRPLSERRAALLLVDCHRYTLSPRDGYARIARERGILRELAEYYQQLEQVVPNLERLVRACRDRGVPIVFTRLAGDGADPRSIAPQARATGLWAGADSIEAQFMPGLEPRSDEPVLDKTTAAAFAGTALDAVLRARQVRHVIIAGVLANEAVMRTAHSASDLGYDVVVVSDACAAETWTLHALSMTLLVGGLIRLRTVSGVLEMLDGRRT